MQKITPFLWFNDNAEEAVNFYVSIFMDAKILSVSRYGEAESNAAGRPRGSVMTVAFQLAGQTFTALNGGPHFKFSDAISFVISCETQQEIDHNVGSKRQLSECTQTNFIPASVRFSTCFGCWWMIRLAPQ